MTKEDKIQAAWIEVQDHPEAEGTPHYNSDGWAKYGGQQNSAWFQTLEEKQWLGYWFYRPKSLEGIETNNGWEKLVTRDDLPLFKAKIKFDLGIMNENGSFTVQKRCVGLTALVRCFFYQGTTHYREVVDIHPVY